VRKTHQGDVREVFDVYLHYMKHVSRGMGVTFERFKQMLEDFGYETEEYQGRNARYPVQNFRSGTAKCTDCHLRSQELWTN
jgi:hypothetical protein